MSEINVNMSVSIPDEIYEKFLIELERDGFVFAKFGEYTLVLSMQVHEVCTTLTEIRDGEYDLSAVDGKHGGTGRRQGSTKAQTEEHVGSSPIHPIDLSPENILPNESKLTIEDTCINGQIEPFIVLSVLNPEQSEDNGKKNSFYAAGSL